MRSVIKAYAEALQLLKDMFKSFTVKKYALLYRGQPFNFLEGGGGGGLCFLFFFSFNDSDFQCKK